jgi:hypothetical protein
MAKTEGAVVPPVPYPRRLGPQSDEPAMRLLRDMGAPRCEMCGGPVVAAHCKRICLRCGFMTGCSEGA